MYFICITISIFPVARCSTLHFLSDIVFTFLANLRVLYESSQVCSIFFNIQRQKCISTQLYFYILYLVKSGLSDRSVLILSRPHPTVQNPPSCHTFLRAWKSDHGRSRTAGPSFVTLKLQLPVATDGCRHCFLKSKSASREKSSKLGGTLANLPSERHRWHTSILKKTIQI